MSYGERIVSALPSATGAVYQYIIIHYIQVHPNLALGGNSAIKGVASFMNNLHHVMQTTC